MIIRETTIDIRNDGGLLFSPPSSYEGRSYEWVNSFKQYKPKKIPAELLEKLQKTNVKQENNKKMEENSNNNEIISLMKMINPEKRKDYNAWLDIGTTLYSIYGGRNEGLQMWNDFSKNMYNYNIDELEERWNTFNRCEKTINSLHHYAKEDNPTQYQEVFLPRLVKPLQETQQEKISTSPFNINDPFYWGDFEEIIHLQKSQSYKDIEESIKEYLKQVCVVINQGEKYAIIKLNKQKNAK